MGHVRVISAFSFVLAVTGCANFNSIYRPFDLSQGSGALIDIKQRAIIVGNGPRGDDGTTKNVVVCAEPPPDALSAYAASLSASGDLLGKGSAEGAASLLEGAAFIGLRTTSTQLLQYSLYRNCEDYLNGAIEREYYDIRVRRSQKLMVALLGIEQLTGAVRAFAATVSTDGKAEAARSLKSLREESDQIDREIKKLNDQKSALGTADANKNEVAKIDEALASRNKDRDAIAAAMASARGLLTQGTATAAIVQPTTSSPVSDPRIASTASAVKDIVLRVLDMDDLGALCVAYFIRQGTPSSSEPNHSLRNECKDYLKAAVERVKQPNVNLSGQPSATVAKIGSHSRDASDGLAKELQLWDMTRGRDARKPNS